MVYVCFLTNGAKLGLGGSVYAPDEVPEGGRGGKPTSDAFRQPSTRRTDVERDDREPTLKTLAKLANET